MTEGFIILPHVGLDMRTPNEGAVYEFDGTAYECTHSPDTMGVPTHRAESMACEFERIEDGEWMSIPVDDFGRGWSKVAKSREAYEATGDEIPLTEAEREQIEERARESWGRLAREFGVSEDDIRTIIVG